MADRIANSRVLSRACAAAILAVAAAAPAHGQGVTATYAPFPPAQPYQGAQQTIVLNFNDDVTITQLQVAPAYNYVDFSIFQNNCTLNADMPAGTTCSVQISFNPASPGWSTSPAPISRSAPLQVYYYDNTTGNYSSLIVPLTGTGQKGQSVFSPGFLSDLIGNDVTRPTGFGGDGDVAANAIFTAPAGITMDVLGNIYIADTGNGVVRLYYKAGSFPEIPGTPVVGDVYTIAGIAPSGGVSAAGPGTDGVLATLSALNNPTGLALDALGNLYISDSNNQAIRMVSAATGIINTVAGTLNNVESPGTGFGGDLGPATQALLYYPAQIAVDGLGNLYIADAGNNSIRVVYAGGTVLASLIAVENAGAVAVPGNIYTIAGSPAATGLPNNGDGTQASTASLNFPQGVTVDSRGNVYIADSSDKAVRRVDAVSGNISSVYAGTDTPVNLSVDSADSIYFTLQHACSVMQYNPTGQADPFNPTTVAVAGNGTCSPTGDTGFATAGGLSGASGIVLDGAGNLYLLEADGVRMDSVGSGQAINFGNVNVGTVASSSLIMTDDDVLPSLTGNWSFDGVGSEYFQFNPNYNSPFYALPYAAATPTVPDCNAVYFGGNNGSLNPGGSCGATFAFQPIADGGPFSAYASTTAGLTVSLTGMGTGPLPTASLIGGPFNFVAIANETSSPTQPLFLKNTSAVNLSLSTIYFSSSNFAETDTCGISTFATNPILAPGAQCEIDIKFFTSAAGPVNGTIYIVDNASTQGGTQTFALNGNGLAPIGSLSVSSVVFPLTLPGQVSNGSVTLTNTGTATLNINPTGFTISGGEPTRFAITGNTCTATLAVNAHCQISLSYSPLTYAYYTSTLGIQDDTGGVRIYSIPTPTYLWNTQTVGLIGPTGNPPVSSNLTIGNASFPQTAVNVGETQTVTLTLGQAAALKSIGMSPGFTEYVLGTITGCVVDGVTVNAAGTVCNIPVTFTPVAPGIRNAPILATDIENGIAIPYSFALSGTGLGPVAALTPGIITTVVGGGHGTANSYGFGDGPSTAAAIGFQSGMAIDSAGQMFISDSESDVIWKTDTSGNIHLYAGSPFTYGGYTESLAGDGGVAIGASLGYPGVIALDSRDGLYLAETDCCGDSPRIRYIDPATSLITTAIGWVKPTTYVSSTPYNYSTQTLIKISSTTYEFIALSGGTTGASQPAWPTATGATILDGTITWKNQGVYYGGPGCTGQTDTYGDGCLASQANLSQISGIVVDPGGNVFFADQGGSLIRRMDATTKIVTVVAGNGTTQGYSGDGGPATSAQIIASDMAFDSNGNLFFIDANGYVVREVNMATGVISTVAGTPVYTARQDYCYGGGNYGGPASAALFAYATSLAIDAANNIYIADNSGCVVSRIDAGTSTIHVVAGVPQSQVFYENPGYGDVGFGPFVSDGDASYATLNQPQTIRLDGTANIYIASSYGGVRKVDTSQSVLNFTGGSFTYTPPGYSTNGQQLDTVSGPQTATVLNAGNSGRVFFTSPFTSSPNWGINNENYIRDVTYPTGSFDCYTLGSIPIGFTCPISVDFAPLVGSGYTLGTDTVNDNAVPGAGSQPIHLIGYVYGPPPLVTLTPPLLSFVTPQGGTSLGQDLTLSNNDVTPLPISSITITGSGASSFSQINDCGATLAAGKSCTIEVFFSPAVLGSNKIAAPPPDVLTATVSVNDTASNTPQQSQLVGTGTLPAITNPPTPLAVLEDIHISDAVTLVAATPLNITEVITVTDTLPPVPPVIINILETITTSDSPLTSVSGLKSTTISLTPSASLITAGGNLVLQAAISSPGTPTGNVTFYDGANVLGSSPVSGAAAMLSTTALSTGSHSLSAVYSGDATFATSTSTTVVVTVTTQNVLTVTPASFTRAFATANPALSYTISGFVNGDTAAVLSGAPQLSTAALLNSPAGAYSITAAAGSLGAPSNYVFTFATGTATVTGGQPQTITFPAIPNLPHGVTHITLTAHSTSGKPIAYTVTSGPATVSGSTLTITGSGMIVITANQPGDATFNPAPSVARTFTVLP